MRASVDLATVLARIEAATRGEHRDECPACRRAEAVASVWRGVVLVFAFMAAFTLALFAVVSGAGAFVLFALGLMFAVGQMMVALPCIALGVVFALLAYGAYRLCVAIDRRLA